mgnify:CR=1 FL=1
MSGPKVIDYQAIERQRAEAARRRWFALTGRADALRRRCRESGHLECAVDAGPLVESSSADLERRCDELDSVLAAAAEELGRRQFADRTREVAADLSGVLADLERRERQAATATLQSEPAGKRSAERPAAPRPDFADRVARQLASLQVRSTELDEVAKAVLAETDPARAHLRYDDLRQRIADANERAAARAAKLAEIAELRAQLHPLADPVPLRKLLDRATEAAERGDPVDVAVRQARRAITEQLDAAAAAADREYVRTAVAESLREQGYEVLDVDVATPETLVFRQSRTHGVRADVQDGRIDIQAVRLGATIGHASRSADRDAEDEFCNRIPGLLTALGRRGVAAGVTARKLPGLFTPETVAVPSTDSAPTAEQKRRHARGRTAR